MPNIFWYYGLALIGIGIAILTVYGKRKEDNIAALIMFYLFAASITYLGEFVALVVFYCYTYKTGVFIDDFASSLVGHLIINATFWPGTAIVIGAYSLGYGWILLVTLFYILAEYLFLKLGIYQHRWWNLYMSAGIVLLYHAIAKIWYGKIRQVSCNIQWYITFFFIATFISRLPITVLLLLGKQYYSLGWVENMYRDSSLFAVIYHFGMSIFYVFYVCMLKKWYWKLVPIVIFLLGDIILINMNILIIQNGWSLLYLTIIRTISLAVFILIAEYTLKATNCSLR